MGVIILILLVYNFGIKFYQIKGASVRVFLSYWTNWFDIIQLLSTTGLVSFSLISNNLEPSVDKSYQRVVASISIFLIWLKVFDWLRLFEPTSFYIRLVTATFRDIRSFMILFFTGLAMFGSSLYMM